MNKSQTHKSKIKTLPNELSTQNQQFLFKSQCEEDYTKKINIASPTFGTEMGSNEQYYEKTIRDYAGKQNRISLCLKEYKNHDNQSEQTKISVMDSLKKSKEMQKNKNFVQKQVCSLKNENAEKTEKLKKIQNQLNKVVERNEYLQKMYTTIKKKLDMKYCESICKVYHHYPKNSSSQYENIDLYIETQALKQDYKKFQDLSEQLQKENEKQQQKIQELQADKRQLQKMIVVYTQKSQKKKMDKQETIQIQRQKMEEMKRKYENKFVMIEADRVQKDKQIKKIKEEYEKIKFLKEEIQKKRKEDLEIREQLEGEINEIKESLKQTEAKLNESEKQCGQLKNNVILCSNKQSQITSQLTKSFQIQLTKLQFQSSKALTQKQQIAHQLENYKLINSKYSQEITQLRADNLQLVNISETLKIEKGKLEVVIMKYAANEDRIGVKNTELQNRIIEMEREKEQLIGQLDKSSKETQRMHSQISSFKEDQYQQKDRNQSQNVESRLTGIIMDLNKQVQVLKTSKQALLTQLDNQKERNQKITRQLEDTCRKMEHLPYSDGNKNQPKRQNFSNNNPFVLNQAVIATKAIPQLRMIKDIMALILNSPMEPNPRSLHASQSATHILECLICDIKKIAEQMGDFFDYKNEEISILNGKILNKEEVISKLLRFTPEHKKSSILEYLKIMEGIQEFSVDQIYKVTKNLEDEANQWKSSINHLFSLLQAKEQEIQTLKQQFVRLRDNRDTRDKRDLRDPRQGWMGAYEKDNRYLDKVDVRRRY